MQIDIPMSGSTGRRARRWPGALVLLLALAGCGGAGDGPAPPPVAATSAPAITSAPTAASITAGESVSFTVVASGTAPLTYQWHKDGVAIVGATAPVLVLTPRDTGGAGEYAVSVSNAAGSATSAPVRLVVAEPAALPALLSIHAPAAVVQDTTVRFESDVRALAAGWTLQWDLGDGMRSTEAAPSRTYAREGSVDISLTLSSVRETRTATWTLWVGRHAQYNGVSCTGPNRSGWCRVNRTPDRVFHVDAQTGYAVDVAGASVFQTADGGRTWAVRAATGLDGVVIGNNSLAELQFGDATTGWLNAEDALAPRRWTGDMAYSVLKTEDRGRSWSRQNLGSAGSPFLEQRMVAAGPKAMAIVGSDILRWTLDGGASWQTRSAILSSNVGPLRLDPRTLRRLQTYRTGVGTLPAGSSTWWAVRAQDGAVLRARNLGADFEVVLQPPGGAATLSHVDDDRAWVVAKPVSTSGAQQVAVWHTIDGGATWTQLPAVGLPASVDPTAALQVQFADANGGWLDLTPTTARTQATPLSLFRTTDGGRSWQPLAFPASVGNDLNYLDVLSADAAVTEPIRCSVFGCFPVLQKATGTHLTVDGGATWKPLDVYDLPTSRSTFAFAPRRWITRDYRADVHLTHDEGRTWFQPFPTPMSEWERRRLVFGVWPAGPRHWFAETGVPPVQPAYLPCTSYPAAVCHATPPAVLRTSQQQGLETADAGVVWQRPPIGAASLPSLSARQQYLGGGVGWRLRATTLEATSDTGKTWASVPIPVPAAGFFAADSDTPEADADFLDAATGVVVHGSDPASPGTVLRTTDGGRQWTAVALPFRPRQVRFLDRSNGVVVGDGGGIATTADGGRTWTARASSTAATLRAVQWVDASTLLAIGADATVLRSTNAGGTWARIAAPTSATLNALQFVQGRRGWIAASGGTVLVTTDGGASWSAQQVGSDETLVALHVSDAGEVRVFGRNGGLYLSTLDGS